MRQFKAEYYKLKYSQAKKWIAVFMVFLFFIPFVVGNDTLFMTFGDYKNIDSIGWICYINDFSNVKFEEISRFALSINFFTWIGLIVYVTTMISKEYQLGTLRASVVCGISKTKLLIDKLLVLNIYFFILYFMVEIALAWGLAWKYKFIYTGKEFIMFLGVVLLNFIVMIGMEMVAVIFTITVKNSGIVIAVSCVYFFAGAITYPMVYENFENRSIVVRIFCLLNPTTYMYNICGYRISANLIIGSLSYGIGMCLIGMILMHFILEKQEL